MQSKQYFTKIKNYPHEKSTEPYFLDKNGILYHEDGSKRIADHTLVALTIMIAESRTEEKEMMVSIIMNCI